MATAAWIDSWNNGNRLMLCRGGLNAESALSVKGSYSAPPGPDWGWRITLESQSKDAWRLVMHNITPEGEEQLAVEALFQREV